MPPRVTKQVMSKPKTQVQHSNGILDRIRPVTETERGGLKFNFYGRNGTGKTTLACTFPKPLLLIGFEDGEESVRKTEGVDFVRVYETQDLFTLAAAVRNKDRIASGGGHYVTTVLDTATSLQDLVLKEILGLDDVPVQLAWGTVSQTQYRQRSEKLKEFLRLFLTVRHQNVVVLGQEKNHTDINEGDGRPMDGEVLAPFIATSIGKSPCGYLHDNVDYICQTYTRNVIIQEEVTVGKNKVTMNKKTDDIEFCLRFQKAHPTYAAKVRADRDIDLPDVIVDPNYETIAALLGIEE